MNVLRESQRQQWLIQTLLAHDAYPAETQWLGAMSPERAGRGLQAYIAHAGALAERALAASFPTVAMLLGAQAFATLARHHWQATPPTLGDVARWGDALPDFIAQCDPLSAWPYLADSARLDRLVGQVEWAADAVPEHHTLHLLSELDPSAIAVDFSPGLSVFSSAYPVATLWLAHQPDHPGVDLDHASLALAEQRSEHALIYRSGWRGQVCAVDSATLAWMHALLRGATLDQALESAGKDFDFEAWLVLALRQQWLQRVRLAIDP